MYILSLSSLKRSLLNNCIVAKEGAMQGAFRPTSMVDDVLVSELWRPKICEALNRALNLGCDKRLVQRTRDALKMLHD